MGGKIMLVVFAVVVLGLVLYAVNSNMLGKVTAPLGSVFRFKPSSLFVIPSSTIPASGTAYVAPQTDYFAAPSGTPAVSSTPPQSPTTTIPASEIPAGFTRSELSPYFKEVTFSGAWPASGYGSYGEIILSSAGLPASSSVDITGWQIKTDRSGEYIPQAIEVYDPSGLTPPSDIVLGQGQMVYLYSTQGSFNLRLNECIGYIGNTNQFTPALPANCPYIDPATISRMGFTGACESYIYSLGGCATPNLNSPQVPLNDYACRDYLANNFNYTSCFNAHRADADFLSNQWWVWMGSSPLDQYHDTVDLLDKNGLLVDQYNY
jgi:hypothetical protein